MSRKTGRSGGGAVANGHGSAAGSGASATAGAGAGGAASLLVGQTLQAKDAALFRQVLQLYEAKAYRKALKIAEGLLKRVPRHGETTCMKALLLLSLPSRTPGGAVKQEAFDLVKLGVSYNVKSHVSWHVYGLMHRADHNYTEACRCYAQALKIEPENWGIMRDYATLLAQTRSFAQLEKVRLQLIQTGPASRANWAALAVAHVLAGNSKAALTSLEDYVRQVDLKDVTGEHRYPYSEFLLYWSELVLQVQGPQAFVKHLEHEHIKNAVLDKQALLELHADAQLQLAQTSDEQAAWDEARRLARELVDLNPDNRTRLVRYLKAAKCSIDAGADQKTLDELDQLSRAYPRADCPVRLALELSRGTEFEERLRKYFVNAIVKGIPSLFNSLRSICEDESRLAALARIAEEYERQMNASSSPSERPWIWAFLAHYYLYLASQGPRLRERPQESLEKASRWIEKAIEHSPTLPELYLLQARILKKSGDLQGAAQATCLARDLDLQDRFINSRCAKALFRIGQIEKAESILGSFGKKEKDPGATVPGKEDSPMTDLVELQATWALSEEALAFQATGRYPMALRRFNQLKKIFEDWREDEHDFHSYCTRRSTLRAYVGSLKFGDQLPSLSIFQRDVERAVEFLVFLHDRADHTVVTVNGHGSKESAEVKSSTEPLSKRDTNKLKKEAKSVAASAAQTNGKKPAPKAKDKDEDEDEEMDPVDDDPDGEKAYARGDFLVTAERWIASLNEGAPKCLGTQLLAFEVYLRSKKYLLAIKALRLAREIAPDCARVDSQLARLRDAAFELEMGIPDVLKTAVQKQVLALYQVESADELPSYHRQATELVQRSPGRHSHLFAAVEIMALNQEERLTAFDFLLGQLKQEEYAYDRTYGNVKTAYDLAQTPLHVQEDKMAQLRALCLAWYPRAQAFGGPAVELVGLRSLEASKPGFEE